MQKRAFANKLLAILFGVALSVGVVFAIEGGLYLNRIYGWWQPFYSIWQFREISDELAKRLLDPRFDYLRDGKTVQAQPDSAHSKLVQWETRPKPETHINGLLPAGSYQKIATDSLSKKTLYTMDFTVDQFGRRVLPLNPSPPQPHALIMIGCSFVFGDGLATEDTLPIQLQEKLPGYQGYNLGFAGYGPTRALEILMSPDDPRATGVVQKDGVAVYLYIDDHLIRVFGSMNWLARSSFAAKNPYFDWDGDTVKNYGNFADNRKFLTTLYGLFAGTEIQRFFNIDLPILTHRHFAFYTELIAELRRQTQRRFGTQELYVVIYPSQGEIASKQLVPLLRAANIPVLDYSTLPIKKILQNRDVLSDGHPSALAIRLVSDLIAQDFERLGIH